MRIRLSFTIDINRSRNDEEEQHTHPDTEALVERSDSPEPNDMHVGFRAMPMEDRRH